MLPTPNLREPQSGAFTKAGGAPTDEGGLTGQGPPSPHQRLLPEGPTGGGAVLPPTLETRGPLSSPAPFRRSSLTLSSPVATLKTSSTTQPTARRAAPDECTSFHMVSLSTCRDEGPE